MQMDVEGFENEGFSSCKENIPSSFVSPSLFAFGHGDCDASGKVWSFDGINFSLQRVETMGRDDKNHN